MKTFKLFMVVFVCMFIFTPILSFAGEVKSQGPIKEVIEIVDNNSMYQIYNLSMNEFIKKELESINTLVDLLDFHKIGFSSDIANVLNSNKSKFIDMIYNFAKPALAQTAEIDSQFASAGAYFDYMINQLNTAHIDEQAVKDYVKTNKPELDNLFASATAKLQQSDINLAKKAVEEYTAKEPQQLIGGVLSLVNPINFIRNLLDFSGMSTIDWVLTIGAGVASFVVVSIGALILGGLAFVLGGIFSIIVGIIGLPVFIIAFILGVINWILTGIMGVISGLAVVTVIAAVINIVTLPLTTVLGIVSTIVSLVAVVTGLISSTLGISIPVTLIGLAAFIFSPLLGAVGGLAGASIVKTFLGIFDKEDDDEEKEQPIYFYPGYPSYGGYGVGTGQMPIQQPSYGYGYYGY
jgi:hypothetical protein